MCTPAWYENCSTCVTGSRSPASYWSISVASTLLTLLKDNKHQLNCERTLLSEHSSSPAFVAEVCRTAIDIKYIAMGTEGWHHLSLLLRKVHCMIQSQHHLARP